MYFAFFDYTIPTTQVVASSAGPVVSYAKYVKDMRSTGSGGGGSGTESADGLLAAVLGMKNAGNITTAAASDEEAIMAKRIDNGKTAAGYARRMRLFPAPPTTPPRWLVHGVPYNPTGPWDAAGVGRSEYPDGMYGFGRRSDFPQLAAYRAPFPPKSVLDVMKYVTGPPHLHAGPKVVVPEYMVAQESKRRYVPIRPAEEVNRFLPDVVSAGPPHGGSKRFRNKFGPPVFLTPPVMTLPDDFMKPPSVGAHFSMDFEGTAPVDLTLPEGSSTVQQSHTDVVFNSPVSNNYPVPDTPSPTKGVKSKRPKNQKPISVMLDIYPIPDHDHDSDLGQ